MHTLIEQKKEKLFSAQDLLCALVRLFLFIYYECCFSSFFLCESNISAGLPVDQPNVTPGLG